MPRSVQQAVLGFIHERFGVEATRKEPANAGNPLFDQPIEAQVYRASCIQSVIHTQSEIEYQDQTVFPIQAVVNDGKQVNTQGYLIFSIFNPKNWYPK